MIDVDNILKNAYLEAISDELNRQSPFYAMVKKSSNDIYGKEVIKVVEQPKSNDENPKKAYLTLHYPLKNLYGTIELSEKQIKTSATTFSTFIDILNTEIEDLTRASKFQLERMLFGDGSGILATVKSVDRNKVVLDSIKNLIIDNIIEFRMPDGKKIEGLPYMSVTGKDDEDNSITVNRPSLPGVIEGCLIVNKGSYNNELSGLGAIFNEDQGHSNLKQLKPYKKNMIGWVDQKIIQTIVDELEEDKGNNINLIICSTGVKKALSKTLAGRGYPLDSIEVKGGYKAISFNGIPVVSDVFCPKGTMYFLNTDDFTLHQLCDWTWLEDETGKILRQIPGTSAYRATLVKYAELICDKPYRQGMLTGITEL